MNSQESNLLVNVGTGESMSILELAEMMIRISGLNIQPIFEKPLEGDVIKSQADTSILDSVFKWKAESKLEDWLEITFFK
jgi:UDP-glucose 4-epimerase